MEIVSRNYVLNKQKNMMEISTEVVCNLTGTLKDFESFFDLEDGDQIRTEGYVYKKIDGNWYKEKE